MPHLVWARPTFIAATIACLGAAANLAFPRTDYPHAAPVADIPQIAADSAPRAANPDSMAALIARRDPFRASRAPATARFDPQAAAGVAPPPPPPTAPRPSLSLAGIVTGEQPAALIDGIPGSDGTRVLKAGERAGDLLVREILPDRVVISGRDTTWTLRVRTRFQ